MRTADEIKSGILDHLHVAEHTGIRDRLTPARVVLVHVGALNPELRS